MSGAEDIMMGVRSGGGSNTRREDTLGAAWVVSCLEMPAHTGEMDKNKDIEIILATPHLLHYSSEVAEMAKEDKELLNSVYREISEVLGTDTAMEMYRMFRGQQISFPVRFFNPECIRQKIIEEYDGKNIGMLAKKFDYSEKTVRRIIKKSIEER